ncbi:hypothetical protein SDC9_160362 [bioreactor metagenome]|uniref:Uncharacterized protein n=1 Tax=bioreactor metagenome TaxID=1076179 RepID=A0A645FHP6_9ZZZZ
MVVIQIDRERRFPEVGHHRNSSAKLFGFFRVDLGEQVDDAVHHAGGEVAQHLLAFLMIQPGQGDHRLVGELLQLLGQTVEIGGSGRIAAFVDHHADQPRGTVFQRLGIEGGTIVQLADFGENLLLHRRADGAFPADGV